MKRVKQLALMLLASLLAPCVWAAAPRADVVFQSFTDGMQVTGKSGKVYTFSLGSGNTINSDGQIEIGSGSQIGARFTADGSLGSKITLLIKYAAMPVSNAAVVSVFEDNAEGTSKCYPGARWRSGTATDLVGFYEDNQARTYYFSSGGAGADNSSPDPQTGSGYLLFSYDLAAGTGCYAGSALSSLAGGYVTGLRFSSRENYGFAVGGPYTDSFYGACAGMKIEKIAVFLGKYHADTSVADYARWVWPTEVENSDHEVIALNFNAGQGRDAVGNLANNKLGDDVDAGVPGLLIPGKGWTQTTTANQTSPQELFVYNTASMKNVSYSPTPTATWTCRNHYSAGECDCVNILQGYLDDNNPSTITVNDIPFATYDAIVIFSTDDTNNDAWGHVQVNGTNYTYNENGLTQDSYKWGYHHNGTIAYGVNAMKVTGLTTTESNKQLTIKAYKDSGARACLAGLVLVGPQTHADVVTIDATNGDAEQDFSGTQITGDLIALVGSHKVTIKNINTADLDKISTVGFTGDIEFYFDCKATAMTVDDTLKAYIKNASSNVTFVFEGSGENGAMIDYGSTQDQTTDVIFSCHIVFDGGTHSLNYVKENSDSKFGANATATNPTFLVTNNATLNFTGKNWCGWTSGAVNANGIIRVNSGSTLNASTDSIGTFYWAQQFYLEPGSTTNFRSNNSGVRFNGGINESAPQIYVPECAADKANKVATVNLVNSADLDLRNQGTGGAAVFVGANATLKLGGNLTGATNFTKYGDGILEITGNVTNTGTINLNGGTLTLSAGNEDMVNVAADATLKLIASDAQIAAGYTATNVTMSEGATISFVDANGNVLPSNGKTLYPSALTTWTGYGADNNFTTPENWAGNVAPTATTAALITSEATVNMTGATYKKLVVEASVTMTGTIDLSTMHDITMGESGVITIDVADSGTSKVKGILGGQIVKTGTGKLYVSNGTNNGTALNGTTIQIDDGTLHLDGSHNGDVNMENPIFVIGENGELTTYGWTGVTGTLTLESNSDKEVFLNDGGKGGKIKGGPAIVKKGSGVITLLAGSQENFGAITVNEGRLDFGSDQLTIVDGVISGSGAIGVNGSGLVTLKGDSTGFSGGTIVTSGELKLGHKFAIGGQGKEITVEANGKFDANGKNDFGAVLTLNGGTFKNSSALDNDAVQLKGLTLKADSTFDLAAKGGVLNNGWNATTVDFKGHKLTKTGAGNLTLAVVTIKNPGMIDMQSGSLNLVVNGGGTSGNLTFDMMNVEVTGSKTLIQYPTGTEASISNIVLVNAPGLFLQAKGNLVVASKIVARIGETPYASVKDAIDNLTEGQTITLVDTTVQLPVGWTTVTKEGIVTIRQKGDVYYVSGYLGTPKNEDDAAKFVDANGGATALLDGDTIVLGDSSTKAAWMADDFKGKKFKVVDNFTLKSGTENAMLDQATVTVEEGKTLTLQEGAEERGVKLGAVTFNTDGNAGTGKVVIPMAVSASSVDGNAKIELSNADSSLTLTTDLTEPSRVISSVPGMVVKYDSATKTYSLFTPAAKIVNGETTTYFETLQDAVDAAVSGDRIVFMTNIVFDKTIAVTGKTITIDFAGHTLSNTTAIWNEDTGDWSAISVRGTANVTITGEGTIDSLENDGFALDVYSKGAILTIENGTIIGNVHAVYAYYGTVNINGGSFSIKQKSNSTVDPYGFTLNCYDAAYKAKTAKIVVTGGTFDHFDPANCIAEGVGTSFVAEGYESVKDGDDYRVQVKLMPEDPTVNTDGNLVIPVPTGAASVVVADSEGTETSTVPLTVTGLYTVTAKDANDNVVSVSKIGVIAVKNAEEDPAPVTTAVAVPFKGATVANLLNTALLNENDELKALNPTTQAYQAWTLDANKKWQPMRVTREGGTEQSPDPTTTTLKRGAAVWVTTAANIVTFGTYEATSVEPDVVPGHNLIGNPTMEAYTPAAAAKTVGDVLIPVGTSARYTVIDKGNDTKAWKCSKSVPVEIPGLEGVSGSQEVVEEKDPTIEVGGSFWLITK